MQSTTNKMNTSIIKHVYKWQKYHSSTKSDKYYTQLSYDEMSLIQI